MSEWQPIETAPKDGTRILLYLPESRIANVVFGWRFPVDDDWMMEVADGAYPIDVPVTHWMPEPEGPADADEALMRELGK